MAGKRGSASVFTRLPADLVMTVVGVLVTDIAVFGPVIRDTPLRTVVGVPFLLFLPGYALVAALFPETDNAGSLSEAAETSGFVFTETNDDDTDEGSESFLATIQPGTPITVPERVLLSFGTSIVIVPLVGLFLDRTAYGIRPAPVVAAVSGVTLLGVGVAARRRRSLPPEDRFELPRGNWLNRLRSDLVAGEASRPVNMLLGIGLLISVAGLGYALTAPTDDPFTEFYLVTEDDSGEYVTNGYPQNITVGESEPVTVAIASHRERPTTYTVVVLLQRVNVTDDEVSVIEEREQSRFSVMVAPNETVYHPTRVSPTMVGENRRLVYLLYVGDSPADPTIANARQSLYLWIDVSDNGTTGSNRVVDGKAGRSAVHEATRMPVESDSRLSRTRAPSGSNDRPQQFGAATTGPPR